MTTAVVILNWNGKSLLEQFLPSVVKHSAQATVYVADNASTDDSVSFVEEYYPQVKIIQNKENGGYAKGYNDALAEVKEDVFILLNSDVEVTANWLVPIQEMFASSPKIAVIQPKILDYKKKTHFEYAGAAGGFIDQLAYPYCRGRIFDTLEEDKGQFDDDKEIFWASGACLAIRRSIFEEVEALDEDYFAHQEEIDLCWRIKNRGYQCWYTSASSIYHLGGATLNVMNPKKTFYNFRNSLYNILKNVPGFKAYLLIFIRMLLDAVAGIQFLVQGKPKHFLAILKAHGSFYKNFLRIQKKRKFIKPSESGDFLFSIVWKYFIKGQKKFHELS
ncbi:glycosyltransferase family 2 protein [Mesonia sp. MT50]|uniref:Glycosyltransferase family 2 protein n=1 Tax=Mesonia profundi TaxID=3070998 RepID=A0ABU1A1X2_9FLAO|nr:glycosyltransferase family 2 protein [Mesonia profundi]MDQ7916963.1 glycosyltransferase family 2 protein [Mesonia profundi]